jgi:MFS superfamily sulfate permease-like transporter
VLTFEALEGLLIAVILSLLALVLRASQSKLSVMGREPGRLSFGDTQRHPENQTIPGLLIVRPDEGLFFANADTLRSAIIAQVDATHPRTKVVLLDLEMSNQLDVPSMDMLLELKKELDNRDTELWLSRVHGPVREALERSEYLQQIGPDKVHRRGLDSIFEYLSREAPGEVAEMDLVSDGMNMTLEVVDRLLSFATDEQRPVLADYRKKLEEISPQLKK